MSTFILGSNGSCGSCTNDPCSSDNTVTDGIIDSVSGSFTTEGVRLRDLSSSTQLIIAVNKYNTDNSWRLVAMLADETGYILGPELSLGVHTSTYRVVRTSDTGNTFALIKGGSPNYVTLYTVDATTLEITATSSAISVPYASHDISYISSGVICFALSSYASSVTTVSYWTGTVTGGGTGMTFSSVVSETHTSTGGGGGTTVSLERVANNQVMAFLTYLNTNWYSRWRGLNNTSGIALGSSGTLIDGASQILARVGGLSDSGDSYAIMHLTQSGTEYHYHVTYGSVGSTYTAVGFHRVACNSSTVGTGAIGSTYLYPITITGSTISSGSSSPVTELTDQLTGINAGASMRFYRSGGYARAQILT